MMTEPLVYLLAFSFSDRHNPNEPPRLPSPSHGDVACRVRKYFNFVGYGGARLIRIRDLGGIIIIKVLSN